MENARRWLGMTSLGLMVSVAFLGSGCTTLRAGLRRLLVVEVRPREDGAHRLAADVPVHPRVDVVHGVPSASGGEGSDGDALSVYQKLAVLRPEDPLVRFHLGKAYLERGMLDQAIFELDMATSLDPKRADGFLLLGRALRLKGHYDLAIAKLRAATVLDPNYVEAFIELGICWDQRGFYERARQAYRHALRLRPKDPDIYNNLGVSYLFEGDVENALKHLKKAWQLDPTHPQANNNLALIAARRRQYDLAFEYFARAQGVAVAHSNVGYLLLRDGELEKAIAHLREAVRLRPHSLRALAHLESALRLSGRVAEAEQVHAQYLRAQSAEVLSSSSPPDR
jgi:Flp pilus assembly protein TadD